MCSYTRGSSRDGTRMSRWWSRRRRSETESQRPYSSFGNESKYCTRSCFSYSSRFNVKQML